MNIGNKPATGTWVILKNYESKEHDSSESLSVLQSPAGTEKYSYLIRLPNLAIKMNDNHGDLVRAALFLTLFLNSVLLKHEVAVKIGSF